MEIGVKKTGTAGLIKSLEGGVSFAFLELDFVLQLLNFNEEAFHVCTFMKIVMKTETKMQL